MKTNSMANTRVLIRFSSVRVNLKLKFQCRVRLVLESGGETHKYTEEPFLIDNKAELTNINLNAIHTDNQKLIGVSVYVISARNRYKAGSCKIQPNEIINFDNASKQFYIERKLEQCPDKQSSIIMVGQYEILQSDTDSRHLNIDSIVEEDRCTSTLSVNDIGRLADFQEEFRNSYGMKSVNNWKRSVHNNSLQKSESKEDFKKRQSLQLKSQKHIVKTTVSSIPIINFTSRIENGHEWISKRNQKRGTLTPQIETLREQDLKKITTQRSKFNRLNTNFPTQEEQQYYNENRILKLEILSLKQYIQETIKKQEQSKIEISQQQYKIKTLRQNLQTEHRKCAEAELQLLERTHKHEETQSERKQLKSSLEALQRISQLKSTQHKDDIQKILQKALAFESQNQHLLFQVNSLKDQLIDRGIGHQNQAKNIQSELTKSQKSNTSLLLKSKQLETQIQTLSSKLSTDNIKISNLSSELSTKDKLIQSNTDELSLLKQQNTSSKQKIIQLQDQMRVKQKLIDSIIKKLEELNIKNDQMKVQFLDITETQIIPIIESMSKFIKKEANHLKQVMSQMETKCCKVRELQEEAEQKRVLMKRMEDDVMCLNNLYEETKFRLEVQITTVEALEQQLFDSKTQLEFERQNAKQTMLLEQRVSQLQYDNSKLIFNLNRIQRQRQSDYESEAPISLIKKLSIHNYRASGCSNFSEQEEIKVFINQLQSPIAQDFWQGDEIFESPIRPEKQISIISQQIKELVSNTPF